MDCSLWLNRKKIASAAQIPDNLDVASLRGYFLAGSLIEWLEDHGGKEYAARLAELSRDDPSLNEKIAEIFGGAPIPSRPLDGADPQPLSDITSCDTRCSYEVSGSFGSINSSFGTLNSYLGFLNVSSFLAYMSGGYGSFGISVFGSGSSFEWEWEWLWEHLGGSFTFSSLSETSFSRWEWLLRLLRGYSGGSFVSASFSETSFSLWEWLLRLLRGHSGGSFTSASFSETSFSRWEQLFEMFGSFPGGSFSEKIPFEMDEYDFIMLKTLMICPLDRFGYGIHII